MPLLNTLGVTNLNTTFVVGLAFLSSELESDYTWALQSILSIMDEFHIQSTSIHVIVTDRELAFMNAIDHLLPTTHNLLCI